MEKSSFFNAVLDQSGNLDRVYLAEDFAQFFSTFIGNGVFPNPSTQCQVVAIDNNMQIRIKAGFAWINGYMYQNTDDYIFDLDPADGVLNRIDRVVLRLDFLERKIKAVVKKGDYASSAVPKALQCDADAYEIALANVYVNKGIISITQANITDLRLNKDLCGIVHGTVDQVDTTAIFNQFQSWYSQTKINYDKDITEWTQEKKQDFDTWYTTNTAAFMEQFSSWYETNTTQWGNDFTTWFNTIKGQLDGDIAAKLSADVVALKESKVDKVTGKGLSTNDYSDDEKQEVAKIPDIEAHLGDIENDITTTPQPNKILKLNDNGELPTSITGDAQSVGGMSALDIVTLNNKVKPSFKIDNSFQTTTTNENSYYLFGDYMYTCSGVSSQCVFYKYDIKTGKKVASVSPTLYGSNPNVAYACDTYIIAGNSGYVMKLNPNSLTIIKSMSRPYTPSQICADNDYIYVGTSTGIDKYTHDLVKVATIPHSTVGITGTDGLDFSLLLDDDYIFLSICTTAIKPRVHKIDKSTMSLLASSSSSGINFGMYQSKYIVQSSDKIYYMRFGGAVNTTDTYIPTSLNKSNLANTNIDGLLSSADTSLKSDNNNIFTFDRVTKELARISNVNSLPIEIYNGSTLIQSFTIEKIHGKTIIINKFNLYGARGYIQIIEI